MERCEKCGKEYAIGEWPFCPHGVGHGTQTFVPYFDEHVSEKGEWVTSLAQRWRLMRENHMDYRGKKVGMPGCMV